MGPDAPTPARGQGLQPYGALDCFRWRSEGVQGASGKPPACIDRRQLCRKKFPRWGMTRRLRRGLGFAVPRGAHTFLSVAKEKCAKESQRHGDSGKKPFIAHFWKREFAMSRAAHLDCQHGRSCALVLTLILFQKGQGFSLRCLSPLCSPAVGGGQAYPLRVGMVSCWLADFGRSSASGFGGREP